MLWFLQVNFQTPLDYNSLIKVTWLREDLREDLHSYELYT